MIFGNNMTALGASNIPMAEGYDCSFGPSLALVESARNDFAMFKAMLQSDFREASIMKESSTGYVQEAEVAALHEAVGGGIFKKIAELIKKLIAKLKALFTNLIARFRGLYMKDKDLVNKYHSAIMKKGSKINNVEVKWRKAKDSSNVDIDVSGLEEMVSELQALTSDIEKMDTSTWDTNKSNWEKMSIIMSKSGDLPKAAADASSSESEFTNNYIDELFDDEETGKLSEFSSYVKVASFLKDYNSKLNKYNSAQKKVESILSKTVKEFEKKAINVANNSDDTEKADKELNKAQVQYDYAQVSQSAILLMFRATTQVMTILYKQNKAAFMKCVTANVDKLDESAIYLDAIGEAAEQEVEDVISAAMTSEEISKISAASTDITDGMEAKCGNALAHGIDDSCCTRPTEKAKADGEIDTNIDSKIESAYFGQLLW